MKQREKLTTAEDWRSASALQKFWFTCWFTCCKPNLSRLRSRDCDSSQQLLLLGAHIVV